LLALAAMALPVVGQETPAGWRCSADTATAYRRDPARNRWLTLVLPVAGQRFVVGPGTTAGTDWELLWEAGDGRAIACAGNFDGAGELRCGGDQLFALNRTNLTFSSRVFGAGNGGLGDDLTAATVAGRCTAL
jgi:hypothetical protein